MNTAQPLSLMCSDQTAQVACFHIKSRVRNLLTLSHVSETSTIGGTSPVLKLTRYDLFGVIRISTVSVR